MSKLKKLIKNVNDKGSRERSFLTLSNEGTYKLRIIRNLEDENEAPFEQYRLHGGFIHPHFQKPTSIKCINYKCPLCDFAKEYQQKNKSEAWRYRAADYFLYNVIDRSDNKLKVLKLSYSAHDEIKSKIVEAALNDVNIGDFQEGRDIEIEVRRLASGKLNYNSYICRADQSPPVNPKLIQELRLLKPLDDFYQNHSRADLLDILQGKVPKREDKKKSRSKSSLLENLTKGDKDKKEKEEKKPSIKESPSKLDQEINDLDIFNEGK